MKKRILSRVISAAAAMAVIASSFTALPVSADDTTVVTLDPSEASPFNNGEFQGWGTALCWWANRIGYDTTLTQAAAAAFFSDTGLGLDIARYNIGGGDDPTHNHITRSDSKVPGVWETYTLSDDGTEVTEMTYDITNDANQLAVAKAALSANPNLYFEGFSNSAPYFMTITGCTSGGGTQDSDGNWVSDGSQNNLNEDMYDDFTEYIADATKLLKDNGITFQSYSPMNEPDTSYWGYASAKQEGCHFDSGTNQSNMIVETRNALDNAGLTDVIVAGMDETSLKSTANNLGKLTDDAKTALGRIDTHTYSDRNYHSQVKAKAEELGKNLWQSEVDKGGNGATLASMIIEDMNGMQPSAWVMWDIIDVHKDSSFEDPSGNNTEANNSVTYTGGQWGVGMADHDNKTLELTNKYYTYGQFTKYINPGDTIIASSDNTLAAYNKTSGDIKIVANNASNSSDAEYEFDLSAFSNVGSTVTEIRTDMAGNEKWAEIENGATLSSKVLTTTLAANTVTTYVISDNDAIENYGIIKGADSEIKRGSETQLTLSTNVDGDVSWSIDDVAQSAGIASITSGGVLTASKAGTVTVTATVTTTDTSYTFSKTYTITVYADIVGSATVSTGKTVTYTVDTNAEDTNVTWSVSDESVATIGSSSGKLTAISQGTVTITAELSGITATKTVNIIDYKLSGTASWSNSSTAPADSADYRKAADGDLTTYFDGTTGGYVMYDYGRSVKINKIKLAARSGGSTYTERTVGGTVQGSNDGIDWTDLYTVTSALSADAYTEITSDSLNNNNAYRYFRYTNSSNMANIAEFLLETEDADAQNGEPTVTDIDELTDDFENTENIFSASSGDLSSDGCQVYASGLERYGNVFVPVKATGKAELSTAKTLTAKDKFRLTFNMFSGWENNGKDNTFSLKNSDGEELMGFTITGGGYNLNEMRIGGTDVLSDASTKPVIQCKSTDKSNSTFRGANGWGLSSQNYANNMGFNKTVTITLDGNGTAEISFEGGVADVSYEGTISEETLDIKSLEIYGSYNTARGRVVSYDNFDADLITYSSDISVPTVAPTLPESGELINMNFDDETLTSTSSYGKASGTPTFTEVDNKKCVQFDNTSGTVVTLTDANGNALLTGLDEFTVSFKVKPTTSNTSWWFFASPNDDTQTYQSEKYLGVMTDGNGTMKVERYNNSGSRSASAAGTYTSNEWNDVVITFESGNTSLYINGVKTSQTSETDISDLLGTSSVLYIGKANWGTGEYAEGYLDDFVITAGVDVPTVTMPDLTAVKSDIDLPKTADDNTSTVEWTSSNTSVITNAGKVTRPEGESADVTLTAKVTTSKGTEYEYTYSATVVGLSEFVKTFKAYAENGEIKYESDYDSTDTPYAMYAALKDSDGKLVAIKLNTADASFGEFENGTYTAECYSWNDMRPTCEKVTRTVLVKDELEKEAYLFVHFSGTEEDATKEQIYFSVSSDGTSWTTLNDGSPVLTSTVGENGVRDPYILRGEDGKFYIIATDLSIYNLAQTQGSSKWSYSQTNGSKNIIVWESDDLTTWSDASAVEVGVDNAGCVWAPEAVYDAEKDAYMVFWASKVSDDSYSTQRVYRSYTKDFKTFTNPEIYIDGGTVSNIDTTITSYKGTYYRFTKNESKSTVIMQESLSLSGEWEDVGTYTLANMTGYEGPTIYKLNGEDKWCLLLDYYSKSKGYKPFVTDDISAGTFTAGSDFTFDQTYRHGTVIPITQAEYNALLNQYSSD